MNIPPAILAALPRLPARKPASHKGDYGRALLVGGSQGMAGSIALAGMAALRSGAGLVTVATASVCQPTVASFEPSLMTIPLPCDFEGRISGAARPQINSAGAGKSVIAFGPGLGQSDELIELVGWLYQHIRVPMVVDADGLNALASNLDFLTKCGGQRILTPHPGEFARLLGVDHIEPSDRERLARDFAQHCTAVVVLKGHETIVTNGYDLAVNPTGNPGMATAGTGDVLTGVIAALVAQGMLPFDAARLGVFVHGLAGDLAAAELGEGPMIASDLIRFLPPAWSCVR